MTRARSPLGRLDGLGACVTGPDKPERRSAPGNRKTGPGACAGFRGSSRCGPDRACLKTRVSPLLLMEEALRKRILLFLVVPSSWAHVPTRTHWRKRELGALVFPEHLLRGETLLLMPRRCEGLRPLSRRPGAAKGAIEHTRHPGGAPVPGFPSYRHLEVPETHPMILLQRVSHPSRVHFDIETDDIEPETRRLEKLGARRIEPVKHWWVMEAPTGHRFCVVRPQRGPLTDESSNVWQGD